ncbi:DUF732 domain-containing protein [Mycobacterium sp. PS03-16]|nr:DUF732 domain-containing protein [Mycobacterium sp. PS03-16]
MLAITVGIAIGGVTAAPASAQTAEDAFIAALADAGVAAPDPANAVALGQSVCPMLAEPGQTAADAAARVADTAGMPLGAATMFTGLAISMFCPAVVARIGEGDIPQLPLGLFGF